MIFDASLIFEDPNDDPQIGSSAVISGSTKCPNDDIRRIFEAEGSAEAEWKHRAYCKLGVQRDKLPPEHVRVIQDFIASSVGETER